MKRYIQYCFFLFLAAGFVSCKKDGYKADGGKSDPHVNMTTYDWLKSQPLFDSLVRIIDRAGMQEAVNGNITLFVTTNYGVADFVQARKIKRGAALGDENLPFSIDSLPAAEMSDSLKMYMFNGKINREDMTLAGRLYDSELGSLPNVQFMIKLRRAQDYSDYLQYVDYVQFTKVVGSRDDEEADPNNIPELERDQAFDCQTSGIITTTGIVHVLHGSHRLFFNSERLN